jgi:hypothetical protein
MKTYEIQKAGSTPAKTGGAIAKMFLLKGLVRPELVKAYQAQATADRFLSSEIAYACEEIARDAGIAFVQYAHIYELAAPLRDRREGAERERRAAIERADRLKRGIFYSLSELLKSGLSNAEKEEYLEKNPQLPTGWEQ